MSRYCKFCGTDIESGKNCDCKKNGEIIRRYCEDCGIEVIEGIVFCLTCGKHFKEISVEVSSESDEKEDLFNLKEEVLERTKEETSEFERKEEKKLPSKGLLGLFEKTYGNKEVSVEEKVEKPTPILNQKEKVEKPTFINLKKDKSASSLLFEKEDEKLEGVIIAETAIVAPAITPETFNADLVYEEPCDEISKREIVNQVIQKKNEREVREKEGITFVPSEVLLGSYALQTQTDTMLLITKYKPVIPKAITVGL